MPYDSGTKLGTYEIVAVLGVGGMGEVYRARDSKLKREVAIKVLPDGFANNAERIARFQREAEVLASLNHPHIATIHDVQEFGDTRFLVLELVEGDTLADRIRRGPLPVEEAARISKYLCEALEAAHEKGIVHRDLKPANVKITPDGTVKVLDFGLAKALEPASANPALSNSPTLSLAGTNAGVILGTAAYMSPEQARGLPADHRSDVFALGCIVYEMLTGRPAFQGETISDILASVLAREPDWNILPPRLNPRLRDLLRRCLEKNPKKRWQAVGDMRVEIESILADPTGTNIDEGRAVPKSRWQRAIPFVTAVGGAAVALLLTTFVNVNRETAPTAIRFTVQPDRNIADIGVQEPALSHDGRYLVFSDVDGNGHRMLRLRSLDSIEAKWLTGTENARYPFWSPDSKFIGFYAAGKLWKASILGGSPETITAVKTNTLVPTSTWSTDGTILFGAAGTPLYRVSASGGIPTESTKAYENSGLPFPQFLPDGRHFLYRSLGPDSAGTHIGSLDETDSIRILDGDRRVLYVDPGYLLTVRDGILLAYPFDPKNFRITGEPIGIADHVGTNQINGYTSVTATSNGILAFGTADVLPVQTAWFDRGGAKLANVGSPDFFGQVRLSPDEQRAALEKVDARTGTWDIWLLELKTGVLSKLTVDPRSERDPIWSPDGQHVAYVSDRNGKVDVSVKDLSAGRETPLTETNTPELTEDWTKDGSAILFRNTTTGTGGLFLLPLAGDRKAKALFPSASYRRDEFNLSPDGRWIAYNSRSRDDGKYGLHHSRNL